MVVEAYIAGSHFAGLSHFRKLKSERVNDGTWAFMAKVPYNILDEAMKEAIQARDLVVRRNEEARKEGKPASHKLSFRTLKQAREVIVIRSQNCVDGLRFYPRKLHTKAVTSEDSGDGLRRRKNPSTHPPPSSRAQKKEEQLAQS
jgi:hypothetical protein